MGTCIKSIREGAEVSFQSCGLSALFYAAFYGHDMIIDYLVNCGASVNEKNLTGVTPLGKAVESGRPDVVNTVKCLLKHRADPSIIIPYFIYFFLFYLLYCCDFIFDFVYTLLIAMGTRP